MIVYVVTNKLNRHQYVGLTTRTIEQRWREHCLDSNNRQGHLLHEAIRKYGIEAFDIEVLYECEDFDELCLAESEFIAALDTIAPNGYNLTEGGEGTIGRRMSDEDRRKISERMKGNKFAVGNKGRTGRTNSEEQNRKIRESNEAGKNFSGHHHTREAREKMSRDRKGKPKSSYRVGRKELDELERRIKELEEQLNADSE